MSSNYSALSDIQKVETTQFTEAFSTPQTKEDNVLMIGIIGLIAVDAARRAGIAVLHSTVTLSCRRAIVRRLGTSSALSKSPRHCAHHLKDLWSVKWRYSAQRGPRVSLLNLNTLELDLNTVSPSIPAAIAVIYRFA